MYTCMCILEKVTGFCSIFQLMMTSPCNQAQIVHLPLKVLHILVSMAVVKLVGLLGEFYSDQLNCTVWPEVLAKLKYGGFIKIDISGYILAVISLSEYPHNS